MAEEIKGILDEYKEHADEKIEEVKRHFDVCKEDTDSKIALIGEQYGSIQEKLTEHDSRFESIQENIGIIKNDAAIIKNDIEIIKNSLKKKVDIDDFEALEGRVRVLESKIK